MHAVGEAHDTPLSALEPAPPGSGVGWILQLVPSQPSASAVCVPLVLV
jgi:hypothetical protein